MLMVPVARPTKDVRPEAYSLMAEAEVIISGLMSTSGGISCD
jgi:hypothetical protein